MAIGHVLDAENSDSRMSKQQEIVLATAAIHTDLAPG